MVSNNIINTETLMGVVYGYYTQYVTLKPLAHNAFAHTGASKLSIFIDLDDIFIHLDKYIKEIPGDVTDTINALTSCIINMCAHYRNFFINTFGVETYIFIIGNQNNSYVESLMCGEYKHPVPGPITAHIKSYTISNLIEYTAYINDVYMVGNSYDFNAMVTSILLNESKFSGDKMPSLVISKDISTLLLGSIGVTVLRPKKYKGQDTSFIVTPGLSFGAYIEAKTKRSIDQYRYNSIKTLLSVLVAFSGFPYRGLKSVKNIDTMVNVLNKCVEDTNNRITNSIYLSDNDIIEIARVAGVKDNMVNSLLERYHSINPVLISSAMKMNGDFSKAYNMMVNMYDPNKMKRANETIFAKYPLDLNAL